MSGHVFGFVTMSGQACSGNIEMKHERCSREAGDRNEEIEIHLKHRKLLKCRNPNRLENHLGWELSEPKSARWAIIIRLIDAIN